MQSRKEYAISLGLAKPGRGRLSKEAWAAINQAEVEGVVFADKSAPTPIDKPTNVVSLRKPSIKLRSVETLVGYTKEGWSVGFVNCRRCAQHANYCNCPQGILAPSIVVSLDKGNTAPVSLN